MHARLATKLVEVGVLVCVLVAVVLPVVVGVVLRHVFSNSPRRKASNMLFNISAACVHPDV